ncbi:pXu [Rhizobium phage 16-3]|uniref:pXu n=1 Tax=Rhizobium phage 16-3 TaxID=10704 RepID=UPI00001B2EC5|nr:pXu [Rhizobium phage 16-3]ABF71278.1 pXu [Rhizobium phage 16-3]
MAEFLPGSGEHGLSDALPAVRGGNGIADLVMVETDSAYRLAASLRDIETMIFPLQSAGKPRNMVVPYQFGGVARHGACIRVIAPVEQHFRVIDRCFAEIHGCLPREFILSSLETRL